MNIFYLDCDPKIAAQYHADKHVIKMILESAQLLCTAHRVLDDSIYVGNALLYNATHINHPSAVWARKSALNYEWLYLLFCELCTEYTYRYEKVHLTETKLRDSLVKTPLNISRGVGFTPPPQAMPDAHKRKDAVEAYRTYYIHDKNHLAKWTKRPVPWWYINNAQVNHNA